MSYNYHSTWFSNLIIIYAKNRVFEFMYVCMYVCMYIYKTNNQCVDI